MSTVTEPAENADSTVVELLKDSSETKQASSPSSQARPAGATQKRVRWDYMIVFGAVHAAALLIFVPYFFSWPGVIAFCISIVLFGILGIPIAFHRMLAHKSFKSPKWFERTLVTLAMCTAQETPARWVAWHRKHHSHSDEVEDPHSPRVSFLWSHLDWLLHENTSSMSTFTLYHKYAKDILDDPYYRWLEKLPQAAGIIFFVHSLVYLSLAAIGSVIAFGLTAEAVQMTASIFVWGVIARTVYVWHITWAVNSVTHLIGYRTYETTDDSKNCWQVALLTFGEGWHNNHHADPAAASVQHRWWEVDLNYYIIKTFALFGLAYDIIPPRHVRKARSLAKSK
ncbi:Fatty acid desaturase [Rubripirellula amarantea]|uniref:Fatty acid desaturase n=1 Tax=Rubripirellula amarantea TaxID=2527999 RepID=A0A5C5WRU7_9BACT|nr:fatty acid desaturase [Rubripirellula amarantea]TWT52899.1 Fatty acid desaturase [Rubripirellula amarantea]